MLEFVSKRNCSYSQSSKECGVFLKELLSLDDGSSHYDVFDV